MGITALLALYDMFSFTNRSFSCECAFIFFDDVRFSRVVLSESIASCSAFNIGPKSFPVPTISPTKTIARNG